LAVDPHCSAISDDDGADDPLPPHAEPGVLRRNTALLAAVEVAWGVGTAVASFNTVVAFLLTRLGAGDRLIGSLGAVWALTVALPQLYVAYRTEHLSRRLTFLTLMHYPSCIAMACLGLVAWKAEALGSPGAIAAVLGCAALFGLSMGAVIPTWVHLVGKVLPEEGRNKAWGRIMAAGPVAGLLGAWLSHAILGRSPNLAGYALCAAVSAIALTVGSSLFWGIIEPPEPETPNHESFRHFLRTYAGVVGGSSSFRRLLFARALACASSGSALAFLSVAAKQRFELPDEQAGIFTAAAVISQIMHGLWGAPLGDRWGTRLCARYRRWSWPARASARRLRGRPRGTPLLSSSRAGSGWSTPSA
jgi:hypothetical protein